MSGRTFSTVVPYAEHHPEEHRTLNPDRTVTLVELPGFLEVGFLVDGVRVPLSKSKAGKFLANLAKHEAAQSQTPQE